jgi:adenine-specific DNA-methyltransferase
MVARPTLRRVEVSPTAPIGDYIADFYCAELRLVIELDGHGHDQFGRQMYDIRRDGELSKLRVTVVRIANAQVRDEPLAVADRIVLAIERIRKERPSPGLRPPSPASGRGHSG